MKLHALLAALASSLAPGAALAQYPPEMLVVPAIPASFAPGLTTAQVQQSIATVKSLYAPVSAAQGRKFEIKYDASQAQVGAGTFTNRQTLVAEITVFAGLTKLLTQDQFGLVLCHEMGHVFGGQPYRIKYPQEPVETTAEGQADYHAMRSCLRRYLELVPSGETPQTTPFMQRKCAEGFGAGTSEYQYCLRALAAGMFLPIVARAVGEEANISFETPDRNVVNETIVGRWKDIVFGGRTYPSITDTYPPNQCRLDTYLAAYFQQPRPRCWYNPADGFDYKEVLGGQLPQPGTRPPTGPRPPANDLAGHPLKGEVEDAMAAGLIRGYRDGTFRPGASITRLETALLLTRLVTLTAEQLLPMPAAAQPLFPDVGTDSPFAPQLAFVKTHGLITLFADGTFRPNESISRSYFTASLYKTLKTVLTALGRPPLRGEGGQDFTNTQGHWVKDYSRILSGFCGAAFPENGGGGFAPDADTSRAYAAAATARALRCLR